MTGPGEIDRPCLADKKAGGTFHTAAQARDLCFLAPQLEDIAKTDTQAITAPGTLGCIDEYEGVGRRDPLNPRNILEGTHFFHFIPPDNQVFYRTGTLGCYFS
jgi:hypothetical protein